MSSTRVGDYVMETIFLQGIQITKTPRNIQMQVDGVRCTWMYEIMWILKGEKK